MPGTTPSAHSSSHSPTSAVSTPAWAPPRSPLPPHRLAKLANALGVSTPLPAVHSYGSSLSISPPLPNVTSPSFTDYFRRSPTPSAASVQTYTSTPSSTKFLLHVVPPNHLPHDTDALEDPDLLPPPGASGYHTQFRRGVLVPVYSTLSSQLAAIAKEYALPSTVGLILYLVITAASPGSALQPGPYLDGPPDEAEEPGPRITEDNWRHIWHRVVRAEKEDNLSVGLKPMGLGSVTTTQRSPSPAVPAQEPSSPAPRSLISPVRIEVSPSYMPMTPSPSTPSQSGFSSQSDAEQTESVYSSSGGPDAPSDEMPLPGVHSPALIPILAKVEFDIDRRKAPWYEPWIRNRRTNQAKRAESRLEMRRTVSQTDDGETDGEDRDGEARKPPMDLELVEKVQSEAAVPRFLRPQQTPVPEDESDAEPETGYAQLAEETDEDEDEDDGVHVESESDAQPAAGGDPLADVFGTDAETWSELHAESQEANPKRQTNPNVVDLALDGAALAALPEPDQLEDEHKVPDNDVEEVQELLQRHSRPDLMVSIPSSPPSKRRSSPSTVTRRQPPPPLDLIPSMPAGEGLAVQGSPLLPVSPIPSDAGSAHLPYLEGATPVGSSEDLTEHSGEGAEVSSVSHEDDASRPSEHRRMRSADEEKRDGNFFEDLDLGLQFDDDTIEYDESDPHDRRRSQFIMRAQLDEIERNLKQLSPRQLHVASIDEGRPPISATLSASPQWSVSPVPSAELASPRQDGFPMPAEGASWPSVPYASLHGMHAYKPSESVSRRGSRSQPPSPPRIAFNGLSTEPPRGAMSRRSRSGTVSNETLAYQRELEERELYPPLMPPTGMLKPPSGPDSPIIPLSPDPFGRFPSEAEATALEEERHSQVHEGPRSPLPRGNSINRPHRPRKSSVSPYDQFSPDDRPSSQTPSSRFSIDSTASDDASSRSLKATSFVSMKSIKKLWRKTNSKLSMSNPSSSGLESGRSSPNNLTVGDEQQAKIVRRKTSASSIQFRQDSRSSVVPPRTPPLDYSLQSSPALPPIPITPSPSSSPQLMPASPEKNGSGRKSILKSWKSASGSLSVQYASSPASTPRSSQELLSDAPIKRRRPSVLDGSPYAKHVSTTSVSSTLMDIPPSPALPSGFPSSQPRKRSSQANLSANARRASRQRLSPSMSSTSTFSSSPPPTHHRLASSFSPPFGSALTTVESRTSFDTISQFEIVSPKMRAHQVENSISFSYR
ncbi:hypothetical protein WOLCODRAFT_135489 [Wolfiporia cocos MD-104 SS10]|uniref:Proteophosphoglycan ppg4 n=1 Tax=Wolfiporia cocos (strain MD-104) TaxID=742152 RepID=A0A2H3JDP2_WOLCO|nr:hypothetical protein WOLCODRAFT_135489 [Wolfiporia cocos MD-104 SS10]